jgi:hypothetical protein
MYTKQTIERFLSRVSKQSSGCWYFTGFLDEGGYGSFSAGNKTWRAHRYSFTVFKVDIPDGMGVHHTCDNPQCVNPDHLWVGTQAENNADKVAKGRHNGWNRKTPHPSQKLSKDQVRTIRECSTSAGILAKEFGVSRTIICNARRGDSYQHVED